MDAAVTTTVSHESHEEFRVECSECCDDLTASAALAGTGGTSYSKAELEEGLALRRRDYRPELVSLPMCLLCGENPGSHSIHTPVADDTEAFAGICDDCWEGIP